MSTIHELMAMPDKKIMGLAVAMARQCADKVKLASRLAGTQDDVIQQLALALIEFKHGAVALRPGSNLTAACFGIVRTKCKSNWMTDRASVFQHDADMQEDMEFDGAISYESCPAAEENQEGWEGYTLDDLEGLSVMDRLLIQHDTLASGAQQAMTKDLAKMFECDERTIRLRRSALRRELTSKFNLAADFFSKKAEPKFIMDKK